MILLLLHLKRCFTHDLDFLEKKAYFSLQMKKRKEKNTNSDNHLTNMYNVHCICTLITLTKYQLGIRHGAFLML